MYKDWSFLTELYICFYWINAEDINFKWFLINVFVKLVQADHQTGLSQLRQQVWINLSSALQDNVKGTHILWPSGMCGPSGALSRGPLGILELWVSQR